MLQQQQLDGLSRILSGLINARKKGERIRDSELAHQD
jgi:hypothetical protein